MKFSVFQLSRRGGREKNEDRMGYSYTRESGVFLLADGMGGHPQGEVAAQIALQTVSAMFQREARPTIGNVAAFLGGSLMAAHHQIVRYASGRAMLDTPRTTMVAAVVQEGQASWVHCGDSRLYVVRGGRLLDRTRDHSYLEAQVKTGKSIEGVNRNVLFTCLGSTVRPMYDVTGPIKLLRGDKIMLCSDGLWSSVNDDAIVSALSALSVTEAIPTLVQQALMNAGDASDNVTALAMEWESSVSQDFDSGSGFTETDSMNEDEFASTIQAGGPEALIDDLDEDAIERSIAEINAAIQRTATAVKKR
ncbi:MAG: serine/threonine-protein phosphatase [Burkholderiaceae bacterium]|jgi:serine/threonine protein phosphatase PrpC|nr:serine/threonine-protein phosphatase [Burkholderiaceae bacterium]